MSLEQEQSKQYGVANGISMFNRQDIPKTDSNHVQKSDEHISHANETDPASSSTKNPPPASQPASSSATVKLVGSNRLFMPIKK